MSVCVWNHWNHWLLMYGWPMFFNSTKMFLFLFKTNFQVWLLHKHPEFAWNQLMSTFTLPNKARGSFIPALLLTDHFGAQSTQSYATVKSVGGDEEVGVATPTIVSMCYVSLQVLVRYQWINCMFPWDVLSPAWHTPQRDPQKGLERRASASTTSNVIQTEQTLMNSLTQLSPQSSSWLSTACPCSHRSLPCRGRCSRGWHWIRKCWLCCLFSFCWGVGPSAPSRARRPRCPAAPLRRRHRPCQPLGCCSCCCWFPEV